MPGQRKQGKLSISFWLTEEERRMIEEAAKRLGVNRTDLLKRAVKDIAARIGVEQPTPNEEGTSHDDNH